MPRTKEAIQQQIEELLALKPRVRQFTLFHDDNHEAIDAQIEVLQDNLDIDSIYDKFESEAVQSSAIEAREWLDGVYEGESLVAEWEPLVKGGS